MLNQILNSAPLFFLIAARCFAMLLTLPLFSMQSVSRVAKIALAGYLAYIVLPSAYGGAYDQINSVYQVFTLEYIFLLAGEVLIGIIIGFFISILFAAFSTAGQFFSFQMGLSAAEAYDALSQVENPLMGQYLNLIAMILFLQVDAFHHLFLGGVLNSFQTFNAMSLVIAEAQNTLLNFLLKGLTGLFFDAFMIALPMVGTFFIVSVAMGILSKAAPQMNLLSEGIPLTMLLGFLLLSLCLPFMCNLFLRLFDSAFYSLGTLFASIGGLS